MIASQKQESGRVIKTGGQQSPLVDLSIIIVNWNSKEYVRKCVQSIYANTSGMAFEIIVVDGASYDGCGEMLACEFPKVRFIQSERNVGFARANNLGVAQSRGNCVLFLNPDTEVIGNALGRLFETLNQFPNAGMTGARLLNSDGTLQTSCIQSFPTALNQVLDAEFLRRVFPRSRLWGMMALSSKAQPPSSVEVISGACIMIKRPVLQELSGFDERYFMYAEDVDLCYRVQKAGFDCLYVPDTQIVHHGGGSSSLARSMFSTVMLRESIFRFLKFHRGWIAAWRYRVAIGISSLFRLPLIAAVSSAAGKKIRSDGSFRKWIFILRWSIGLESWAAKKSGDDKSVKPPVGKFQDPTGTPSERGVKQCAA
jgi:GT2 family glycosyltransferase